MNAYELAKELDSCFTRADWNVLEAATMLRQKADCILVLEANHKIQLEINDKALEYIAELEKAVKDALEIGIAEGFVRATKERSETK